MPSVMSAILNTVSITQFNRGLAGKIFEEVKAAGAKVVMKNNVAECVLLSPDEYVRLMDELNDVRLLRISSERMPPADNSSSDVNMAVSIDGFTPGSIVPEELKGCNGTIDEAIVREKYRRLTLGLIERKLQITTMESCTSGQVASLITDTEGSSAVMKGAFVTYSNEAKIRQGVPAQLIEQYGVYSPETAASMAENCRASFSADIGIGVTGSFGNADPGNADSIPGEVWFAIACSKGTSVYHCTVPEQPSRLAYKIYMADVIANRLLVLLENWNK